MQKNKELKKSKEWLLGANRQSW